MKLAKRLDKIDAQIWQQAFQIIGAHPDAIDLSVGFPEENTPDYIKVAGIAAIKRNFTRYTPANGIPKLRKAVANKLSRDNRLKFSPDNIAITPGLATGHLSVFMSLLNPGDEVILFEPYFSPFKYLAEMLGARVVLIDTFPTFIPKPADLKAKLSAKTKLIVINSPNNPTGVVYPEATLRRLAAVAATRNVTIMSDEIFEHFSHDVAHFSIGSLYKNTITLNGFSKTYAMTGWRLGYIAAPSPIIEAINRVQQYTVFSSSSIAQSAGLKALERRPQQLSQRYRRKRDLVRQTLNKYVRLEGAQGAIFAFFQLPRGQDIQFVKRAAAAGVLLLPGSAFSRRNDYIRLSYGASQSDLKRGLAIIGKMLG